MRRPRTQRATTSPIWRLRQAALALLLTATAACGGAAVGLGEPEPVEAPAVSFDAGTLPFERGDDPSLDQLYDECRDGELDACDALWEQAPAGSAYEAYGSTCGQRIDNPAAAFADCADGAGLTDVPYGLGDDGQLDALHEDCENGSLERCDELWIQAPVGSEYELYGATCGGRIDPGETSGGTCGAATG